MCSLQCLRGHSSDFDQTFPNISDPVFSDLESGVLRTEPKLTGEGVAISCHVGIDLEPSDTSKERHRVIIENVPGVPKSLMQKFLSQQLKTAAKDSKLQATSTNGRKVLRWAKIKLHALPARNLVDSLKSGKVKGIELVSHKVDKDGFDEPTYLSSRKWSLAIKPESGFKDEPAVSKFRKLLTWGSKRNYEEVRVTIERSKDKKTTVSFSTDITDIADAAYTRSEKYESRIPMSQCEEEINEGLADAIERRIAKMR